MRRRPAQAASAPERPGWARAALPRGRRANLALLVALAVALVTGTAAFAFGTATTRWVVGLHGAAGLALLVLVPAKGRVVRRGWPAQRATRSASALLGVCAVVAVGSGLLLGAGVDRLLAGVGTMQVHVPAAIAAGVLVVWHAVARPARPHRSDLSRRALLQAGGLLGATAAAWLGVEGVWRVFGRRGAHRRFTGSVERGSGDPGAMPITSWFDDRVLAIDPGTWRLRVRDARGARELDLADLDAAAFPGASVDAVLDCTSGWWSRQRWDGVALRDLVVPGPADRSLVVRSATGYARRLPLRDLDGLLLATRVGGRPLSPGHGAPARLVAPGRRGFWWVKWVVDVRSDPRPAWAQPPFPLT